MSKAPFIPIQVNVSEPCSKTYFERAQDLQGSIMDRSMYHQILSMIDDIQYQLKVRDLAELRYPYIRMTDEDLAFVKDSLDATNLLYKMLDSFNRE